MALRVHPQTPLSDGLRQAVLQLIEQARADLARTEDRAEGVHEARKTFKKARAIARLVRTSLGPQWSDEDRFWRDLGRGLSAERDAQAVIEAYDALVGDDAEVPGFRALREVLVRRHQAAADTTLPPLVRFPADDQLASAAERVRSWPLSDGFAVLADGLEEGYRRALCRGRRARREPTDANLHAWRRAVKQHAAHVRLFREAAEGPLTAHLELVDALARVLGDDHDLAVLRRLLTEEEAAWSDPNSLDALLEGMARRHSVLHRAAFSIGERALAERPPAFGRRLVRYWRAFVRDTVGERAERSHPTSRQPDQAAEG